MIYLNLFIIAAIIVYIIDLSGFMESLEQGLAKWIGVKRVKIPKPFSCSQCLTWWSGLIYLIIAGEFSLPTVFFCALTAYLTTEVGSIFFLVKSLLQETISEVYAYFIHED